VRLAHEKLRLPLTVGTLLWYPSRNSLLALAVELEQVSEEGLLHPDGDVHLEQVSELANI